MTEEQARETQTTGSAAAIAAARLVGRRQLLERLERTLDVALRGGGAAHVHISGPEGIGKSHLIDSIEELVEDGELSALLVRSTADLDARPYAHFARLISRRLYLPVGASDTEMRSRLEEGVSAIFKSDEGLDVARRIGTLIGVPFPESRAEREVDAARAEQKARDAIIRFFRIDAQNLPIILVFDDVEDAEARTLSLIRETRESLQDVPIAIITAADASANLDELQLEGDGCVHVELEPLSDDEIREYVAEVLEPAGTVPEVVANRICECAVGNPLVARQALRILGAEGVIDTSVQPWRVDLERLDQVELPRALEDVIRTRIARLSDEQRAILEDAALVGRTFWLGALISLDRARESGSRAVEDMWPDAERRGSITAVLEELVDNGLIIPSDRPAFRGQQEFRFKHEVERRTLAEGIDDSTRRTSHCVIAHWVLGQPDLELTRFAVLVAEHFERGGLHDDAARYYHEAGRHARMRYVNDRAIKWLRKALENTPTGDFTERIDILFELATIYEHIGRHERSINALCEASLAAWKIGSRANGGAAFEGLGRAYRSLGDYNRAFDFFMRARELFAGVEDRAGIAASLDGLGRVQWLRGNYDSAFENYTESLEIRKEIGDRVKTAASLNNLGTLLVHRGQFREALQHFREALKIRREVGDMHGIAESLNTIGVLFTTRGDNENALRLWNEALDVAQEVGDRSMESILLNNIGEIEIQLGELDSAEEHLNSSRALGEQLGEQRVVFDALRNLGVVQAKRGAPGVGAEQVDEALAMARSLGARVLEGIALRTLAEIESQTIYGANADESQMAAERAYRDSIRIFKELGNDAELGRVYHSYGTFLIESGLLVQGRKHLEMAKDIFERLEMRGILEQTEATIGAL